VIFKMRRSLTPNPIPSLGGATVRHRPVIPLTVIGPKGQWSPYVKVDTSADDVVFPLSAAALLGIDLRSAPQLSAGGVGGRSAVVQYAPVILVLTDNIRTCRWRAVVGFTAAFLKFPLLGIAGGLEFFRTTLDGFRKEVELVAQPHLPATQGAVP
jgi:hypothetical protein